MIPLSRLAPVRLAAARSLCCGRRAFTLVELLVVIGIVAVLAGLSLPVVSNVRESGNSARCIGNLKQIGVAIDLYANDNNNDLPPLTDASGRDWDQAIIMDYLPARTRAGNANKVQNKVFDCPSAKYSGFTSDNVTRTYSCAETWVAYPTYNAAGSASPLSYKYARKRTNLESMANALLLFDGVQVAGTAYCTLEVPWAYLSKTQDLSVAGNASTYIDYRHNKAFHGLYADGHIDTIPRAKASTLITKTMWTGVAQ